MRANIPRIKAQKELETRKTQGRLDEDRVYNLYLLATGDPDLADTAMCNYVLEELKGGRKF